MGSLWRAADAQAWAAALAAYPAMVAARGQRLPELDQWYSQQLPALIAARPEPHVTADELVRITEWKMKRGVWRARNLALVRGNDPEVVIAPSTAAFARADQPRAAVQSLTALAGVGPATASAVLAAAFPAHYPFFDEEAAAAAGLTPVAFTIPFYLRYAQVLRDRAAILTSSCATPWTADQVGRALWAATAGDGPGGA